MHLVLGSQVQSQLAYSTLPTLLSIMETIKKLFNANLTPAESSSSN